MKDDTTSNPNNVVGQAGEIQSEDRCRLFKQQGLVLWFTGLSGSGKSTIAIEVEKKLVAYGRAVNRLDGDNLRQGLNRDLKFSEEDRDENIRRITEVALLFKDAAFITLVSAIAPYIKMRKFARNRIGSDHFMEVYVKASLEECIKRDPKGLYKKAISGQLENFTGISDPYEEPENPDLVLDTMKFSVNQCAEQVWGRVCENFV
ncbi:MAG: adenylyl-sulfate kinase [Desulfosporosinus sp.]|nr:adenylyl-sulfate kinase [Desulfosporosinus sp.]